MSRNDRSLPADFPEYLTHSDEDTPVPSWEQVTRSAESLNGEMAAHVSRMIAGADGEDRAREAWGLYPSGTKRSIALLVDKIYDEGWLDAVGRIKNAWDGGFFFWPSTTGRGTLRDLLNSKSGRRAAYTFCSLRNGLFAYINAWNHRGWRYGWMETDEASAALHVGIFKDGSAEVHLEVFNPLFITGAPARDVISIPFVGSYNHRQFVLHRRWEQAEYGAITRTSANFYHLMRGHVPLSF
ncbi:MAG TPA: hypothetical protein VNI02_14805 [Blastocatellia bacterium]|jgi:hypothetical protein|nr:hypothetical protein [Blastocatellia bacterium]